MRSSDDTTEQASYRHLRNKIIQDWRDSGLLNPKVFWSKHLQANKISMCRQAMDELKWSVYKFDQRMEDWISHARRKMKKNRKKLREEAENDSTGSVGERSDDDNDGDRRGKEADGNDDMDIVSFRTGDRVSVIDAEGTPMMHATIEDDEPPLPDMNHISQMNEKHHYLKMAGDGAYKHIIPIASVT